MGIWLIEGLLFECKEPELPYKIINSGKVGVKNLIMKTFEKRNNCGITGNAYTNKYHDRAHNIKKSKYIYNVRQVLLIFFLCGIFLNLGCQKPATQLIVIGRSVNLRAGPGTDYEITGGVKRGNKLVLLEENNGWAKVKTESGKIAWIYKKLVKEIKMPKVKQLDPDRSSQRIQLRPYEGPRFEIGKTYTIERNCIGITNGNIEDCTELATHLQNSWNECRNINFIGAPEHSMTYCTRQLINEINFLKSTRNYGEIMLIQKGTQIKILEKFDVGLPGEVLLIELPDKMPCWTTDYWLYGNLVGIYV